MICDKMSMVRIKFYQISFFPVESDGKLKFTHYGKMLGQKDRQVG